MRTVSNGFSSSGTSIYLGRILRGRPVVSNTVGIPFGFGNFGHIFLNLTHRSVTVVSKVTVKTELDT